MSLNSRSARKALAVAGIGAAAAIASVGTAEAATIKLKYLCNYPLIGIEPIDADVVASIPDEWPINRPTGQWAITATATTSPNTWTGLNTLKGKRLETVENIEPLPGEPNGNKGIEAAAKVILPPATPGGNPSVTNVFPLLGIEPFAVPARKQAMTLVATGTTPTITLVRAGAGQITVGNLAMNLRLYDSAGAPIDVEKTLEDQNLDNDPSTFEVYCAPATAADEILDDDDNPTGEFYEDQNLTLTNIDLVDQPNKPGIPTATVTPAGSTSAVVKWGASTLPRATSGQPARTVAKYEFFRADTDAKIGEAPGHANTVVAGTEQTTTLNGLPAGTYGVYVKAVEANAAKVSNPSPTSAATLTIEDGEPENVAPNPPTALTASAITQTSATVSWTAATDSDGTIAGYEVTANGETETVTGTSIDLTDLTAGTKYPVSIKAKDDDGALSTAATIDVDTLAEEVDNAPTAPGKPAVDTASITKDSVKFSWAASTDDKGVDKYVITLQDDEGGAAKVNEVPGTQTDYTATGLASDTLYTITVKAVDTKGQSSPASAESTAITLKDVETEAPTAPGNFAADPSDTAVVLTWTAATDNVGVTAYDIYDLADQQVGTVAGDKLTTTISGLQPNKDYEFGIKARDAAGNQSTQTTVTFKTDETVVPNVKPTAPVAPAASAVEQTTATLSWGASEDTDGTIAKYVVSGIGAEPIDVPSGTSIDLTELTANTSYTASIVAVDDDGASSDPSTVTFKTKEAPVDNVKPSAPAAPAASAVEQTTATLTWGASEDTDGTVEKYVVSGIGATPITVTEGTSVDLTELTANTDYTATIVAVDDDGASSDPSTVTFKTKEAPVDNVAPTAPVAPAASAVEQTTATLTWGASEDSDGTVESYIVSGIGATPITVTEGTSVDLTELTANTDYTATIVAVDDDGASSDPSTVTFKTKEAPVDNVKPSAPAAPAASAVEQTTATLTWGASEDSDGTVESYIVSGIGATPITVTEGTSVDLTELTANTSYTASIVAVDDDGEPSEASTVTFKTKEAPVDNVAPTAPVAPAASAVEQTTATLTWGASDDTDGDVVKYVITGIGAAKESTTTSIDLTELTANTDYTATIVAVDDDGASSDPSTVSFKTKEAPVVNVKPTAPTALAASAVETTTAKLTWTASSDSDGEVVGYEVSGAGATQTVEGTTLDLAGLTPNTSYTVTVKAKDDDDALSDAATVTFKTKTVPPVGNAPTISRVTGSGIAYIGGIAVISGDNLGGTKSVKFGTKQATGIITIGQKQIIAFAPAQKAGSYKVTVETKNGVSAGDFLFKYNRLF